VHAQAEGGRELEIYERHEKARKKIDEQLAQLILKEQ